MCDAWMNHIETINRRGHVYRRIKPGTRCTSSSFKSAGIIRCDTPWVRADLTAKDLIKLFLAIDRFFILCGKCDCATFRFREEFFPQKTSVICCCCGYNWTWHPWIDYLMDLNETHLQQYELWESIWEGIDT